MPQVLKGPASVMATVRIQPVFFPGDALEPSALDFLAKFAKSPYWSDLVAEYGVGAATVAPAIDYGTAAPGAIDDPGIGAFLTAQIGGNVPEWQPSGGATLATTVYVLFYPSSTDITGPLGVKSCSDFGAYHSAAAIGNGQTAIYAVMARCPTGSDIDQLTQLLSHELAEAATDPTPLGARAFGALDPRFYGWQVALQGPEICDLCQANSFNVFTPGDLGYSIERCWSNASAAAYGEMCAPPQDTGPAFYAAPTALEDVVFDNLDGTTTTIDGVNVQLGKSRTIDIGLLSAGPTAADFQVDAFDWESTRFGNPQALDLSLDGNMGHDGDVLHLTITPLVRPQDGVAAVVLRALLGNQKSLWVLSVGVTN
jgi:hypothetical protein